MVIVFNSKATTLQTYTNNRGKLREAVRSIQQTQRPTRIEEALTLAESLANPSRSTEDTAIATAKKCPTAQERTMVPIEGHRRAIVHLYSDGRFAKLTDASPGQFELQANRQTPAGQFEPALPSRRPAGSGQR